MKAIESIDPINSDEQTQQRDIVIEYQFSQSPKQVWRMLSEPELLAAWLLPNAIDAEFGRSFKAEVGQGFRLGKQLGGIDCEVLACEPERLLSYSWRTERSAGDLDTVVTFVLEETANGGTYLRLVHSGFPQPNAQPVMLSVTALPRPITALLRIKAPIVNSRSEVKLLWAA